MGLLMKMNCTKVVENSGGVSLPLCKAHDFLEAWPPAEEHLSSTMIYHHGIDPEDPDHCEQCSELSRAITRETGLTAGTYYNPRGKGSEVVTLRAVADGSKDNAEWAAATPHGELECTINNPEAWDFYEAGESYMIRITKHQPQKAH